MMKGGDWAFGCQLVDGALGALGTPPAAMPMRIFTPQVLAPTGAKLSKSLLREQRKGVLPTDVGPWMLDTTTWSGDVDNYVDALVWLVGELLTDPKHFFRSFTAKELGRLMTNRPVPPPVRAHEMSIQTTTELAQFRADVPGTGPCDQRAHAGKPATPRGA